MRYNLGRGSSVRYNGTADALGIGAKDNLLWRKWRRLGVIECEQGSLPPKNPGTWLGNLRMRLRN